MPDEVITPVAERPAEQQPAKTRKTRVDKGKLQLSERDLRGLQFIGEQKAVRSDQLIKVLGIENQKDPESAIQRVLAKWRSEELIEQRRFLYKQDPWVWSTRKGLSWMGLHYKLYEPTPARLEHYYWVNEARLLVEARKHKWVSERYLQNQQAAKKAGSKEQHLPDAEVTHSESGNVIAIEVEITPKSKDRLKTIVIDLLGRYKVVWYFVTPTTKKLLQELLETVDEALKKRVVILDLPQPKTE